MIEGSDPNGTSVKIQADVICWLKQNGPVVGLLVIASVLVIQNFVIQSGIGSIRATIQSSPKASATRELLKRAEQSLDQGEREIAQVYFLNAAAKAPEDLDVLSRYAHSVLDREPRDTSEIDRLRSILQMASYQVAPENVSAVLELLAKTSPRESGGHPPEANTSSPSLDSDLASTLAELAKVSPDIWKTRESLDKHVEQLRALVDQIEIEKPDDAALLLKARQEQRLWSAIDQTSRTTEFIDTCLNSLQQLKTGSQLESDEAVALVQAAEQMLVGFWGVDLALLPASLKEKRHSFPMRIREFVDDIAKAKSLPILAKIEVLCTEAETNAPVSGQGDKKYQDRIKWFEGRLENAQLFIVEIKATKELITAQKKLRGVQDLLSVSRREQFNAYQREAIQRCDRAFKKYNEQTVVTEAKAVSYFESEGLDKIDQSLLSPEVSRILSELLGKLFAECGPAKIVELESLMGNPDHKLKLESF